MHAPWREYEVFEEWALANGYAPDLSVDRIDNARGYYPDNCRWATHRQQQNNKTTNIVLEIDGQRMTTTQAAERYGLCAETIRKRLRAGLPPEEAVRR